MWSDFLLCALAPPSETACADSEWSPGKNSPSSTMEDSSEPPGEDFDAVESPETLGADSLTSEFRLIAARAKDPLLDPKQRAVAAMTMIFGTRRKYKLLNPINL